MMDAVGTTKVQLRRHYGVNQCMKKRNCPYGSSHLNADLTVHDGRVVEWSADSHKAVKCHHWQQHGLSATQEVEEMKLSYASQEGNCFVCREKVLQHFWHCYSGVGDI